MKTRVILIACLVALIVPSGVRAQDDDRPFPQPMYLIHITETGTMDGPRIRDDYMLYPQAPQNGILVTPDGTGGTFTNKAELIGGPFGNKAEACRFARGDNRFLAAIGCSNQAATTAAGGGFKAWWNRQSTGVHIAIVGGAILGVIMLGMFLMSAAVTAAIAAAAAATSAFAEEFVVTYLGGKVTKEVAKRLVLQIGKTLTKQLGRRATEAEVKAAVLAAINAVLLKRGLEAWTMAQLEVLFFGIDFLAW